MHTDHCRLSIAATGAFFHPLGDQTPIDCRYGELIDSVDLPHKQILRVSGPVLVSYGALVNPRAVIVWNVSGEGLQVRPTPEEAAAIAAAVLHVGLTAGDDPPLPTAWQEIRPAQPGSGLPGATILWLAPKARVILRPANPGTTVTVRVLVIPGPDLANGGR
jgi:hypothetical protein